MKVLSVRQPWAHLIIHGGKFIENSTWNTLYRGPLFIHASRVADFDAMQEFEGKIPKRDEMQLGGVIGAVELWNVVKNPSESELEAMPGAKKWYQGPYAWLLRDPHPLEFVRLDGQLGLWKPPEILFKFYKMYVRDIEEVKR